MRDTVVGSAGLITALNRAAGGRGALKQCLNALVRRGEIKPRPPLRQYDAGGGLTGGFQCVFQPSSSSALYALDQGGNAYVDTGFWVSGSNFTATGGPAIGSPPLNASSIRPFEAQRSMYFPGAAGTYKLDKFGGVGTPFKAGLQRGLDLTLTPTGTTGFLATTATAAYRVLWGYIDNLNYVVLGAPGGRYLVTAGGTGQNVTVKSPIPSEILAATTPTKYFYMIFRAPQVTTGAPTDEYRLAFQSYLTATDVANLFIQITDVTPDAMLGPDLYTNPSQESALFENSQPPIAQSGVFWKGCAWFGSTIARHRLDIAMLATPDTYSLTGAGAQVQANTPGAGQATYTFATAGTYDFSGIDTSNVLAVANCTNAGNNGVFAVVSTNTGARQIVVTNGGAVNEAAPPATAKAICAGLTIAAVRYNAVWTEDIPNKRYVVGATGTTSTDVQTTAQSLIRCVNYNATATVYAHDVSSVQTAPGRIRFEERAIGGAAFTVQGFGFKTSAASGAGVYANKFAPDLNTARSSDNRTAPGRLHRSKYLLPEACPSEQFDDIGSLAAEIQRIVPLRDSLYLFKKDGLFRVTGDASGFSIALREAAVLLVDECAVGVLGNVIYAVTTSGIVAISDAGEIAPLDADIRQGIDPWLAYARYIGFPVGFVRGTGVKVAASPTEKLVYFSFAKPAAVTAQLANVCYAYAPSEGKWSSVADALGLVYPGEASLAGGKVWWCATTNVAYPNAGLWTEEIVNPQDPSGIPSATLGVAGPGDRLAINITAVGASTVTITTIASAGYMPVVGDVLISNKVIAGAGHVGSAWSVTAVNGSVLTLASYITTAGDAVNGTGGFEVRKGLAVLAPSMMIEPQEYVGAAQNPYVGPFVGGASDFVKVFSEVDVLMSRDSTADAVTVGFYGEVDPTVEASTTSAKAYSIRETVPVKKQTCSRLSVQISHTQRLKYLVIEGLSYEYEPTAGVPLA